MSNQTTPSDGGFTVTPRMRQLYERPGYLGTDDGGQELRDLYQLHSADFDATRLNHFALSCFFGCLDRVKHMIATGQAPPLNGTETPFKFGYATLVVAGCQRVLEGPTGSGKFAETLKFLLSKGCPPDVEDICQYTALHHATMNNNIRPDLARILLENGSNVNHLNKYGAPAIVGALMEGHVGAVDVLMEFGADLNIADADGFVPAEAFVTFGPQVTAVVTKWLRKRSGEQAPLDEKKCDFCGKTDDKLKLCVACHSARYCSRECQKSHWKVHKPACKPFTPSNTVTLKPSYHGTAHMMPTATLNRQLLGIQADSPSPRQMRGSRQASTYPKSVIVKIQVPYALGASLEYQRSSFSSMPLLVYTKKRDFVCQIRREDDAAAYDRVTRIVKEKGVGSAKGYFAAELKSVDELVVKIGELLAEQPF
ncbi:ankyrin [Dentipellis sp. KUC8613]|nr:ankyrin [Dentipellis sp. KUC8613]